MDSIDCVIYRCARKTGMYLYLRADIKTDELPADLLKGTGQLERSFELTLSPERKLARENTQTVMGNLAEQGFHLQLPPPQTEAATPDERLPSSLDVG